MVNRYGVDETKVAVGDTISFKGHAYRVRSGAVLEGRRYFVVRTHNTGRAAWIPVERVESHARGAAATTEGSAS